MKRRSRLRRTFTSGVNADEPLLEAGVREQVLLRSIWQVFLQLI